jgi:hypothetical protein
METTGTLILNNFLILTEYFARAKLKFSYFQSFRTKF